MTVLFNFFIMMFLIINTSYTHLGSQCFSEMPKNSRRELTLISLNIWGGNLLDPLLKFIKKNKATDIFCFQEVYSNAGERISTDYENPVCLDIQQKIKKILPDHRTYFKSVVNGIYGISIFVHKDLEVIGEGEHEIHSVRDYSGRGPTHSRILQWLKILNGHKIITVVNLHGLWNGKGKKDSPNRILQSEKIKTFVDSLNTPFVLCGDFNLSPNTESFDIISSGKQDLISLNNVKSTRSDFYKKPEKFADYIFLSNDLKALDFQVLSDQISDHLPLFVKIGPLN